MRIGHKVMSSKNMIDMPERNVVKMLKDKDIREPQKKIELLAQQAEKRMVLRKKRKLRRK